MQRAALAARRVGVVQQKVLAARIIFKYLHATENNFACCPKGRNAVRSAAYTRRAHAMLIKQTFRYMHQLHLQCH